MTSRARAHPSWANPFSAQEPAWLAECGAAAHICLSSRVRVMRNLQGRVFPHMLTVVESRAVAAEIGRAAGACPPPGSSKWHVYHGLGPAERDQFVAERLISPEFEPHLEGRWLLLDEAKRISVMVNEEDHLRFQALTPGWSIEDAARCVGEVVDAFGSALRYAASPRFGYLSASPFNCGDGVRMSAMFHLIGLAQTRRLPSVLSALSVQGVTARGLFGESSRAIGALLQVSVASANVAAIQGAGDYLLAAETAARREVGLDTLKRMADEARTFGISSRTLSLANALRVVAWVRWAAAESLPGYPASPRIVDGWLSQLALRTGTEESRVARDRAARLRALLEG